VEATVTRVPPWRVDSVVEWALDAMRVSAAAHLRRLADDHDLAALGAAWRECYSMALHLEAEAEEAREAARRIFEERT
jgi:hypothetical protein